MPVVAIPFVPMPQSQNPNVKGRGSETYLVSSFVTLASLRRWNPGLDLRFVSDQFPADEWRRRFEGIGVDVEIVPFSHRPPEGFADRFLGSLYLLDVVSSVDADYLCTVDPDVFCVGALDDWLEVSRGILALNIESPRDEKINGLSPSEADSLHEELGEPRRVNYHYGGEFYGIPDTLRRDVVGRIDQAWAYTLDQWRSGGPYFTTEEHVMNYALAEFEVADASPCIRRVWTAHSHRTVRGDESSLKLWHLPSEKERGFKVLYPAACSKESWFWRASQAEFIRRSGLEFGVTGRRPLRFALDSLGSLRARMVTASWGRQ